MEYKLETLESLVVRNNINIDLLANRDSLKTILLLFSFNIGETELKELKSISESAADVLRKLNRDLNPEIFIRSGISNQETISEEKKAEIKRNFIFAECIHFIVCSIDNIVHPKENGARDVFSQITGKRTKEALDLCLIQFFENQKTTKELTDIIKIIKLKSANMGKKKIYQIN